jgi:hypothetical protein
LKGCRKQGIVWLPWTRCWGLKLTKNRTSYMPGSWGEIAAVKT